MTFSRPLRTRWLETLEEASYRVEQISEITRFIRAEGYGNLHEHIRAQDRQGNDSYALNKSVINEATHTITLARNRELGLRYYVETLPKRGI